MSTDAPRPASTPTWMIAVGWILTLLPAAALIASAVVFKLMKVKPPEGTPDTGWPASVMTVLAIVEIGCALLYLFPRTAALGAILVTGYLGGAVAAHVRIGDAFLPPVILGVLVWLGLFFRDARVRALMPIRSYPTENAGEPGFVGVGKTIGFGLLGLIVVLIGVAAVVLGIASTLPVDYLIEHSITIDAPASEVFPYANDFHKWEPWNPWLKDDPATKVTYDGPEAGKDAVYHWKGNEKVGEGTMTILESVPNERIKIKIDFIAPRQGTGDVGFTFKEENKKTVVTWSMAGQNHDLFEKALYVVLVENIIHEKYSKGLASMKSVVEAKK